MKWDDEDVVSIDDIKKKKNNIINNKIFFFNWLADIIFILMSDV